MCFNITHNAIKFDVSWRIFMQNYLVSSARMRMTCASKYNDVFMMENGSAVVKMLKSSVWYERALLCLEQALLESKKQDMLESIASCTS